MKRLTVACTAALVAVSAPAFAHGTDSSAKAGENAKASPRAETRMTAEKPRENGDITIIDSIDQKRAKVSMDITFNNSDAPQIDVKGGPGSVTESDPEEGAREKQMAAWVNEEPAWRKVMGSKSDTSNQQ